MQDCTWARSPGRQFLHCMILHYYYYLHCIALPGAPFQQAVQPAQPRARGPGSGNSASVPLERGSASSALLVCAGLSPPPFFSLWSGQGEQPSADRVPAPLFQRPAPCPRLARLRSRAPSGRTRLAAPGEEEPHLGRSGGRSSGAGSGWAGLGCLRFLPPGAAPVRLSGPDNAGQLFRGEQS